MNNGGGGNRRYGFTIVELLIVIVVIAILAAIVIVAYSGVQNRARDEERRSDIAALAKAMEIYYVDNGFYPTVTQVNNVNWRRDNMPQLPIAAIIAPGQTGNSLAETTTPTVNQYGFGSCNQCPRFYLYWRSQATGDVIRVNSLNGQP